MTALQWAGAIVTAVVGLGGIVSLVWAVGKVKTVETSIAILVAANKGLEGAYAQLEARQEAERAKCDRELSELRGQVKTLTGEFGRQIAAAIVNAIKEQST